jgi:hypothetical protein
VHPSSKKSNKKYYFIVLEKNEIIHVCTYHLDIYSCKFSRKNTAILSLHKKEKMEICTPSDPYYLSQIRLDTSAKDNMDQREYNF